MLIEKAAGNFLQLLENVGDLADEPLNFVDGHMGGPLTDEAVTHIRDWECGREQRVEQRFKSLEENARKTLGWSSHLGTRFLHGVIEDFARERLHRDDTGAIVERCVDPYVVLDRSSALTREFRDRAYHRAAERFRIRFLRADTDRLTAVLRSHLIALITATIDADGCIHRPGPDATATHGLMGLSSDERREVLDMALQHLHREGEPDWTIDECRTALQATCLAIELDATDRLWGRVQSHLGRLAQVRWEEVPEATCGSAMRKAIVEAAIECGRWRLADPIAISVVDIARRLLALEETPERLWDLRISLERIGDVAFARGQLDDALCNYEECLIITRRLLALEETSERLRDLSVSHNRIGNVAFARGQLDDALCNYEECLSITRRLLALEETPERLRDLRISLERIGDVAIARGNLGDALCNYEECLSITRWLLAIEEAPERLRDLSSSLNRIGNVTFARGQLDDALCNYEECLSITRRLLALEETPERLRDLRISLERIGDVAGARGNLDDALSNYEEGLDIDRRLLSLEETPERLGDLSSSLNRIGDVAIARGNLDAAIRNYEEGLAHATRVAETAADLNGIAWLAHRVGSTLCEADRHAEALETASRHLEHARSLEADAGDDVNTLDTCAAFWETLATAAGACGRADVAAEASALAAALRRRVAEMTE